MFFHLFPGDTQNAHNKEDKSLSLSMPVITEEEEENESFSETGTDEILSNYLVKESYACRVSRFRTLEELDG